MNKRAEPIVHRPYDLGLGFQLGWKKGDVGVSGHCLVHHCLREATLIWELTNAPKPNLVITFEDVEVLRVLDETWLSTETDPDRWQGIDGSFARTVEGGEYPTTRELMDEIVGPVTHYEFLSDFACVNVIAHDKPKSRLIDWDEQSDYFLRFPRSE